MRFYLFNMKPLAGYADSTLFDIHAFTEAATPVATRIKVFKQALKHVDERLNERYLAQQGSIRRLVCSRAWVMDQILQVAWQLQSWSGSSGASLIAVGGYGRGELLPKSDIDLLLLFGSETSIQDNISSIEQFLTFLWDINLEVGHSVRTVSDCQREAKDDITIATNLMECRLLIGEQALIDELYELTSPKQIWPGDQFFRAKMNEQVHRHEKYNDTEYSLEPNVKTSPGALRDIQTVGWVVKRYYNADSLNELVSKGFLTENEYRILMDGQIFLWKIRYGLHMHTKRHEDRLRFDLQKTLAEQFGYQDNDKKLAVEQLMQDYFRWVFQINHVNNMLLQLFREEILEADTKDLIEPINSRFQARNQYIEAIDNAIFKHQPHSMLEIFLLLAQNPKLRGIRADTGRAIIENRDRIDSRFRTDIRNTSIFMEFLRSPLGVNTNLHRMNRYGILGRYIPEFGKVIGQMQFDLFHAYTVDAHTLLTVRNLRKFRHRANTVQYPIATRVYHQLPKPELAFIAALFHDIGKGRGGDHSKLGARDAARFCARHQLNAWETEIVVWLVEHHLLMSLTSQREDLSDPLVIATFAEKIQDLHHLNYLYVLSVADISATHPELWTSWRASLMKKLYEDTHRFLRCGNERPIAKAELIKQTQDKAIKLLTADGFSEDEILAFWDTPGDDYFLRESAENIVWHTKTLSRMAPGAPTVLINETNESSFEGATQIFIYAPDRPNLFADIVTTLDQLNLSIQDARIMTSEGSSYSLDTFIVLERDGTCINSHDPERLRNIQHRLLLIASGAEEAKLIKRRNTGKQKHFKVVNRVTISSDIKNNRTVVEVIAADSPGLLAQIAQVFKSLDITILNARITTLGERAEDVFFVGAREGGLIKDPELCALIQTTLLDTLNQSQD